MTAAHTDGLAAKTPDNAVQASADTMWPATYDWERQ
jgi:hypothetical protein